MVYVYCTRGFNFGGVVFNIFANEELITSHMRRNSYLSFARPPGPLRLQINRNSGFGSVATAVFVAGGEGLNILHNQGRLDHQLALNVMQGQKYYAEIFFPPGPPTMNLRLVSPEIAEAQIAGCHRLNLQ
jgi:hypothetical protein